MKLNLGAVLMALLQIVVSFDSKAEESSILYTCKSALTKKWPRWQFVTVSAEVADSARRYKQNPTITYGDFDGDSKKDVALLIQTGTPAAHREVIAICLANAKRQRLYIIDEPYCTDGIALSRKGQRFYNYETNEEGTYQHDGISAYCFEKAGATYIFDQGIIRQIIDSD